MARRSQISAQSQHCYCSLLFRSRASASIESPPVAVVKQISAKPMLLAATVFAYGNLAPVDCSGLSAEIEAARAKVGQPANLASVGGTTQRKTRRAVGGLVTSGKVGARASIVSSKSPRGRQPAVKQNHKIRLGANQEAARVQKRNRPASGERSPKSHVAMFGLASFGRYGDRERRALR